MTQAESEIPAGEALNRLNWAVGEMWKHTMHDDLCCDAECFGDPIHIEAMALGVSRLLEDLPS